MFGKLVTTLFGKKPEETVSIPASAVERALGRSATPLPHAGTPLPPVSKPLPPRAPTAASRQVTVALYPGKREDALFLEWIDAVAIQFRLMRERTDDCEGLISKWLFNNTYRPEHDLSETNRMLYGQPSEPAWAKSALSVVRSLEPKGVAFGNHISKEIITGKKKLMSRPEAEKLLKLFDHEPLLVETWNAPHPPGADFLVFKALGEPDALSKHLSTATSATPTTGWEKTAVALAKNAGANIAQVQLEQWLSILSDKSPSPKEIRDWSLLWHIGYQMALLRRWRDMGISPTQAAPLAFLECYYDPIGPVMIPDVGSPLEAANGQPMVMSKENANLAKGTVWLLAALGKTSPEFFEKLALASLTKYDLGGTYNSRQFCSQALANACIFALGRNSSPQAVMALGRIRRKIRDARIAAQVDKTMQAAAAAAGMSAIDLEETAVPDFDMGLERWSEDIDGTVSTLLITPSGTDIQCVSSAGKPLKTVPASVKSTDTYKEMKAAADEIDALLPLIRWRIEASWLGHRQWSLEDWRERYGEHPVARAVATPLIWWVKREDQMASAIWRDGKFFDINGNEISSSGATIRLWHPVEDSTENTAAWRRHLVKNRIVQPFKQAHREVYPLTDAERETGTFSNRYAAHILKQHQYMALAKSRGWKASHRMNVDAPNDSPVMIDMPAWNMWAEIFIEGAGGDDPETLDSGAYVYVLTDQVRFHNRTGRLNLTEVPPLVFSEVMRDCDLFVGVASIGADPNWINGGADARRPSQWDNNAAEYWHEVSFQSLSESAKLRKELIAELLPSMTIAPLCEIHDKYLRVKGKLRTYRIHFNSGNILMEPNDTYLCIVPSSVASSGDKIFVPFEGDRLLSIILSKAIMLANDQSIRDTSIVSQITR